MLIGTRSVALALTVVLGAGTATPASAEEAPLVTAGTLLPQRFKAAPTHVWVDASAQHLATMYGPFDQTRPETVSFHSLDGALVRDVPVSDLTQAVGSWRRPKVLGSTYLLLGESAVEARDLTTGDLIHRIDNPSGHERLAAGADWILTSRTQSGSTAFHLTRADGSQTQLSGIPTTGHHVTEALDQDARSVVLHTAAANYLIDVATGAVQTLPTASWDSVLTEHRVYWLGTGLSWVDRGDFSIGGQTPAALGSADRLVRWGEDGVAFTTVAVPDPYYPQRDLSSVDPATGAIEPVVGPVAGLDTVEDGSVVVALRDTPTGRIARVAPGQSPTTILDLPAVPMSQGLSGLSGDWVAGGPGETTEFTSVAGGGQWQSGESALGIDSGGTETQFAGQTLLSRRLDEGWNLWQVSWPGGSRQFSTSNRVRLGHGGQLVLITQDNNVEVQDARTGQVFGTYEEDDGGYAGEVIADGTWVWHVENTWNGGNVATLRGHDTSGANPDRELSDCGGVVDVRGRWMLCTGNKVIDLRGVAPTWTVPTVDGDGALELGNGFIARPHRDGEDGTPLTLVVTDLAAGHAERRYGPMRAEGYDWYIQGSIAVDDAGGARVVYIDTANQLRTVALEWLGTTPWTRPDKAKPRLATNTGSARIVKSAGTRTSITAQVTYNDTGSDVEPASGVKDYDARYQTVPRGTALGTTWTQPSTWKAMPQASVTLSVAAGTDTCFQFRARDNAGNSSTWYTARCVEVDGTGPKVTKATVGPRVQVIEGTANVRFDYAATDSAGVAFYELAYKAATGGKGYGSWTSPTSWKKRTSTTVTKEIPRGGDTCFRVRATDKVGNVGPWSAEKCTAVAYGEDDFQAIGQTKDDREKLVMDIDTRALDDRVAVMVKAGGELRKSSITARQIGVWVIAGPSAGKLDVYIGSTKLGRISTASSTRKRVLMMLPAASKSLTGTLRIVSVDGRNAKVDAVAVLRQS